MRSGRFARFGPTRRCGSSIRSGSASWDSRRGGVWLRRPVPPENSRMFYEALRANKVPAEYLELASGGHGLNGYKGPMWDAWQARSLAWLAERKLVPASE